MTTILRWLPFLSVWWPAALAIVVALTNIVSWQDTTFSAFAFFVPCAAIALAKAFPRVAVGLAALGSLLTPTLMWPEPHGFAFLAVAAGAMVLATWHERSARGRLLIGAILCVSAAAALFVLSNQWLVVNGVGLSGADSGLFWTLAMLAWALTLGVRTVVLLVRAEQAKAQALARTSVVETELRDERVRADLTHDFHDVMAHSLAVLAAQAEGLRLTHASHPERIEPVLTTISDTARAALVEVRQLLERVDDDARRPQPTTGDIPALVEQTRSAGPRVTVVEAGSPGRLSQLGEIAAFRIAQESLTNALRHAGSDIDLDVVLTWTGPGLGLVISSPLAADAVVGPPGRGITGMRERTRFAGGTLDVETERGRFIVSAHLPYETSEDDGSEPPSSRQQELDDRAADAGTPPAGTASGSGDGRSVWGDAVRIILAGQPQADNP